MSFNLALSYLRSSVQEDLGDVSELIGAGLIDRYINEGQRRMEPDILLAKTLSGVTIATDATTYTLPTDLVEITQFVRDDTNYAVLPSYFEHAGLVNFYCPLTADWAGKLHYRAHFPAITDDTDAQVPAGAADGLISFALYKSYRRLASNRAEYRKFATIIGNGVTMADLEATAEAHLQDFIDATTSAVTLPSPITHYQD